MFKLIKRVLKLLFTLLFFYGIYIGGTIFYATITDYKPEEVIELPLENQNYNNPRDSVFELLTWNIGYAGLGAEEDFFYDGGKSVRAPEEHVKSYLSGIRKFLKSENADFYFLQEVDSNARRSYLINEYRKLAATLDDFVASYAPNYKVRYVPAPFERPWDRMGRVHSGLVSFSKYQPEEAKRFQFPGNYDWPKSIFMLDRCFLQQRIRLSNGKDLVLINTHNSAFDDGSLRSKQLNYLKAHVLEEYKDGNYVIVGGDWNQSPPRVKINAFLKDEQPVEEGRKAMPEDVFPKNWIWAYGESTPTNRSVKTPWIPQVTDAYLVDYFLLSPNVELLEVNTIDMNFAYSDHQPVKLKFKIK